MYKYACNITTIHAHQDQKEVNNNFNSFTFFFDDGLSLGRQTVDSCTTAK